MPRNKFKEEYKTKKKLEPFMNNDTYFKWRIEETETIRNKEYSEEEYDRIFGLHQNKVEYLTKRFGKQQFIWHDSGNRALKMWKVRFGNDTVTGTIYIYSHPVKGTGYELDRGSLSYVRGAKGGEEAQGQLMIDFIKEHIQNAN